MVDEDSGRQRVESARKMYHAATTSEASKRWRTQSFLDIDDFAMAPILSLSFLSSLTTLETFLSLTTLKTNDE